MKIARGHTRVVIIFKNFVIKLPRIYVWRAIKSIYRYFLRGQLFRFIMRPVKSPFSPWRMLFIGIITNWREYRYCKKLQTPFLQETYLSIFGLLNIQKTGQKLTIKDRDLWCQLVEMTNKKVWADGHTFSNVNNFCNENGHLKMIDYGNKDIFNVLKEYGNKIFENFDFSLSKNIKIRKFKRVAGSKPIGREVLSTAMLGTFTNQSHHKRFSFLYSLGQVLLQEQYCLVTR